MVTWENLRRNVSYQRFYFYGTEFLSAEEHECYDQKVWALGHGSAIYQLCDLKQVIHA